MKDQSKDCPLLPRERLKKYKKERKKKLNQSGKVENVVFHKLQVLVKYKESQHKRMDSKPNEK